MRSNTSTLLRAGAITPMALAAALCFAGTAHAAVPVNWSCQASVGTSSQTTSVTGTAPGSVTAGSAVAITIAPGSSTVPSSALGFTVNNINNMKMLIPVPANSTYVSSSASGGGLYPGSTALVGSNVVLTIPGPIPGGTTYTPPQVTINVTATAPGSITSKYAGTSYSNPGMTFTTNLSIVGNVATSCYPNPSSPTLTTTTVT
jgi:dehydratase